MNVAFASSLWVDAEEGMSREREGTSLDMLGVLAGEVRGARSELDLRRPSELRVRGGRRLVEEARCRLKDGGARLAILRMKRREVGELGRLTGTVASTLQAARHPTAGPPHGRQTGQFAYALPPKGS